MRGVGIVGAGPGVAALHLPTVARVGSDFRVVHISDGGSGRAAVLASRVSAAHSSGIETLLADPDVEVVVIASPPHLHASHVLAAIAAGKRGILCEKPLALTAHDVDEIIDAAAAAGVALLVGTNHLYDPVWGDARHHASAGGRVLSISITASLPPNGRYHSVVTEPVPAAAARPTPDLSDPEVAAAIVRQLVLGLLVHDLPLVRDLAPGDPEVIFARLIPPIGCAVGFVVGGVKVQISAALQPEGAEALWRLAVTTATDQFEIDFPPSFVHGGGAQARVTFGGGRESTYPSGPDDGYIAEWRSLAAALDGVEPVEYADIRADAQFAVQVADRAANAMRAGVAA